MTGRLRTAMTIRPFETRITPAIYKVLSLADSGPNSLRDFIGQANANPGADTIHFNLGLFTFESRTITLTTGELAISDPLTINGPGAGKLTISGNVTSRIINTALCPASTSNTITGMHLSGGIASSGGAIFVADESLSLNNCIFSVNTADEGGAVYNSAGWVVATDCSFTNNGANDRGGALASGAASKTILRNCTVANNKALAVPFGSAAYGGGVYAQNYLLVENCAIYGNTATAYDNMLGGGILASGAFEPGALTIRNSTICENYAKRAGLEGLANGGGIGLTDFAGTLVIQNSTLTRNSSFGAGGGIRRFSGFGTVQLESTIIAQNSTYLFSPDMSFATTTTVVANNSIVGVGIEQTFVLSGAGNQTGTLDEPLNAKLGLLVNNGGSTLTCAPLPGSPAINFGANPLTLLTDQRGLGYARTLGGATDVGAFEFQPPVNVSAVQINDGALQRSRVTSLLVTFDATVTLPANVPDAFLLVRQSDGATVATKATVAGNSVGLTFDSGPVNAGSLADGRYTLTVMASKIANLDGDGNGTPGDDYVLVGNPATNKLFRLFGDADGDGDVDTTDFGQFRAAFGGSNNTFDFDNDGDVDTSDFGQFRGRFGATI